MSDNFLNNGERYVVRRDIFGRQVLQRTSSDAYRILVFIAIVFGILLFPLFPLCFALWAFRSKKPKTRLYAALASVLLFCYLLFDLNRGWFVPYFFGHPRFFHPGGFAHGHLFKTPVPFIVLSIVNVAGVALSLFILYRYFKPKTSSLSQPDVNKGQAAPDQNTIPGH